MSFDTDPSLYSFLPGGSDCAICFPANEAPDTLALGLSGIQIGDLWTGADPPPPNGTFLLTNSAPCFWTAAIAGIDFLIEFPLVTPQLLVDDVAGRSYFFAILLPLCSKELLNAQVNPAIEKYYGGSAKILNPLDSGPNNNIELMGLLNIEPAAATFCKPSTLTPPEIVNRYSRRSDATNIHIKYDLT